MCNERREVEKKEAHRGYFREVSEDMQVTGHL